MKQRRQRPLCSGLYGQRTMDAQHETEHIWPQALADHRLADGVFADAYDRIPDLRRAQLKTAIAGLYAMYAGRVPAGRLTAEDLSPAGTVFSRLAPKSWTLVCIDATFASPSRLLAACLPALCARVPNLAVVRLNAKTSWPPALALAMELAGVENAFDCGGADFSGACASLAIRAGSGLVCDLGTAPSIMAGEVPAEIFRPRCGRRIGVWEEGGEACDLDALAFAQPDCDVSVQGNDGRGKDAFDDFLGQGYDAVWVAGYLARPALSGAPLVLTPGRETFWAFPELFPERFLDARLAMLEDSTFLERPERT